MAGTFEGRAVSQMKSPNEVGNLERLTWRDALEEKMSPLDQRIDELKVATDQAVAGGNKEVARELIDEMISLSMEYKTLFDVVKEDARAKEELFDHINKKITHLDELNKQAQLILTHDDIQNEKAASHDEWLNNKAA